MEKETQCKMIFEHMKKAPITGLQALKLYGCIHLPRRILDLKENGVQVKDKYIKTKSNKRIKEYWI